MAFLKQVVDTQAATGFERRLRGLDEVRQQLAKHSLESLLATAGISADQLKKIVDAYMTASNSIIMYGRTALQIGAAVTQNLASAAMITGKCGKANNGVIALTSGANTIGATALGIRPAKGGASAYDMWSQAEQSQIRGLFIVGMDPAGKSERAAQALETVAKHGFVAVQSMFMSETAKRADVVLPLMATAERDGTITNAERRVQRFRTATAAPAAMMPTWQVCATVAEYATASVSNGRTAVASGWNYAVTSDVTDEIASVQARFAGVTYTSLDLSINSWGRQTNELFYYDGTSYSNSEGLGVQLASIADDNNAPLHTAVVAPVVYEPKGEFTMLMQMPVRAYDGGEWSTDSKLASRQVTAHVVLSVADASRWGIAIGDLVALSSPVGSALVRAQIDTGLAEGQVLMPDVAGAPTNLALGAYTRVSVRRAE